MFELFFTHPLWAYRTGTFAFAAPWPHAWLFAAVLAAAAVIAFSLHRLAQLGAAKRIAIGVLQMALLAVVIALLQRPVLEVERVRDRANQLALLIDASASMNHNDGVHSRSQQALRTLHALALPKLNDAFELRAYAFAQQLEPVQSVDAVTSSGPQTRIGDALQSVLNSAGAAPLAGVVLISDGAENGDTLSEERLAQIAAYGVPVHTVGVGPENVPGDLELEHVDAPETAPVGARLSASIALRHAGEAATRIRVYDERNALITAQELKLPSQGAVFDAAIELPPLAPGAHALRFSVDALEGESNLINNARTRLVNAPPERRNVLYIEGEPRWEYKFIRRALERDRAMRLVSVVRTTPNKYYRQGVASAQELGGGFPQDAAELFRYEAIIIGSFEAASLSAAQHALLRDFVDRRGGAVLLLAGRNGLSGGGWQNAPLAQALPVHLPAKPQNSFVQRSAQALPTLYGQESTITRIDDDAGRNLERWRRLPPLADWQNLGKLKPGAVVLLEAGGERGRSPLLVWQHYGRGAAYVLGTASTLRWQMHLPPDDQSHETFWRQLLLAMTANTPMRAELRSERAAYEDETTVALTATLRDERFEPINAAHVELQIAPQRGAPFTRTMTPSGRGDGDYAATFDAETPGVYRIDMRAFADGREVGAATTQVLRTDGAAEHFGAWQHRDVLERIAAVTGGRYWRLDELDSLAAAIPYSKAGVIEHQLLDLWNLPIVFLVLLALKCAEWALRLRWGRL